MTTPADSSGLFKVLHIADVDFFARFGRMFRQLALALDEGGIRAVLVTDDPEAAREFEHTPIECIVVPALGGLSAWRLPRWLKHRLASLPRLVHLWGTAALGPLGHWGFRHDVPLLVHLLSEQDVERVHQRGVRANVHLAAGCSHYRTLLEARHPRVPAEADVIVPGLLPPVLEQLLEQRPAARARTLSVFWAGDLDEHSGLDVLIEAFAQLKRTQYDVQGVLIGGGPAVATLRKRIRENQVQGCVTLIEQRRWWDHTLHGADVFVVPARQRSLSLPPLLAMAYGKGVIASRDQAAEWFREDETIWAFTPGSGVELAYQLSRAASAVWEEESIPKTAAAYARKHHGITQMTANLMTLYRTLADQ